MATTEEDETKADALFHALADRTRRDILRRVLAGEHSVSGLARNYGMSFAAVQKHVAVLERAGLISKRRSGREALASGEVEALRSVASMLTELESVWRGRVARIDDLLSEITGPTSAAGVGRKPAPSRSSGPTKSSPKRPATGQPTTGQPTTKKEK